jgi:cysteinyl-tRNA synthetase
MEYLGETFDIHTGGVDNIFPHHENEIAQSEGVTGKPFVNYWLHSEHLIVEGEKMSKSKGNYLTLKDLLDRGENPVAIRYLLLSTHYRKQLNFTYNGLKGAYSTIKSVWDLRDKLKDVINKKEVTGSEEIGFIDELEEAKREFEDYLDDDLSISPALASIYEFIKFINIQMDERGLNPLEAQVIQDFFNNIDKVLDVFKPVMEDEIPGEIKELAERRANARENGNYALADEIRGEIEKRGFSVEDTPDGYRVLKKR